MESLEKTLFSAEKWFVLKQAPNRKNDTNWSSENCLKITFSLNNSFSMHQIKGIKEQMCPKTLFHIYIPCFKSVASIIKKFQNCKSPLGTFFTKKQIFRPPSVAARDCILWRGNIWDGNNRWRFRVWVNWSQSDKTKTANNRRNTPLPSSYFIATTYKERTRII